MNLDSDVSIYLDVEYVSAVSLEVGKEMCEDLLHLSLLGLGDSEGYDVPGVHH